MGKLHPENIPEVMGTEYVNKIAMCVHNGEDHTVEFL